jgi:hypothetical protein
VIVSSVLERGDLVDLIAAVCRQLKHRADFPGACHRRLRAGAGDCQITDLNGDARADIFSAGTLWLARSNGGFEAPQDYWLRSFLPIRIADINGDGKPDLIVPDDESDSVQVLFHR